MARSKSTFASALLTVEVTEEQGKHTAQHTLSFPLATLVDGDLLGAVMHAVAEDKEVRAARSGRTVAAAPLPLTHFASCSNACHRTPTRWLLCAWTICDPWDPARLCASAP